MFEHVFQDLTYAHNHLYHTVNCMEQVITDFIIGGIGLKSYRRVLIHEEQLLTVSYDAYSLHKF